MDHQSWMNEDRSSALFFHLEGLLSDRKFRLLAVAIIRTIWKNYIGPAEHRLLEAIEREADVLGGKVSPALARETETYRRNDLQNPAIHRLIGTAAGVCAREAADGVAGRAVGLAEAEKWDALERVVCDVVREVAGYPFQVSGFEADWRTSTVVLLATQTYDTRDFSAMPILADALQDAGCTNEDALQHLRGQGPHCRGCWVLYLVLGKE